MPSLGPASTSITRPWYSPAVLSSLSGVWKQPSQKHACEPGACSSAGRETQEDSQTSISLNMKDTILTKWRPSLIHTLLITYQSPLTPVLWWDLHGPFMGWGERGKRWRKGKRRGVKIRGGGESVNKRQRRRRWMISRGQKDAEQRGRNVWQINDEWKDWRRPITQKTRETDRKISPNDPLTRRRTKMASILYLGSLGDAVTMMMMVQEVVYRLVWNQDWPCSLLNTTTTTHFPLHALAPAPWGLLFPHNLIMDMVIILLKHC